MLLKRRANQRKALAHQNPRGAYHATQNETAYHDQLSRWRGLGVRVGRRVKDLYQRSIASFIESRYFILSGEHSKQKFVIFDLSLLTHIIQLQLRNLGGWNSSTQALVVVSRL